MSFEGQDLHRIIGGLAAARWGIARTTVDVAVVRILPQERLSALLVRFGQEGRYVSPSTLVRLSAGAPVKLAFTRWFSVDLGGHR
ncbi:hypothetical protein [Thermoflexus sp.]|uniref:hypothetical protein n=1 Tax=Thermoflexus sp. TaxID=1969742 RepID=UPI0035E45EF1